MSFTEIPIQPVPTQAFLATLDDGTAQITLTTTSVGLLADVVYEGVPVANGRLCLDRTNINTAAYLGLPRGLYFVDLRGTSDPQWADMGDGARFRLWYGDPDVVPSTGGTTPPANTGGGTWVPPPTAALIVTETGTILATQTGQFLKAY